MQTTKSKGKEAHEVLKVAAVQESPSFLNVNRTIAKIRYLVEDSAHNGADLIAFGESFIPAFPVWNLVYAPIDQHDFFKDFYKNSIEVPGKEFEEIASIAKENKVYLSVGITEKGKTPGSLWNTNLLFDSHGNLINKRRKLVPTWAEKLTWSLGDASGLKPVDTYLGKVGVLICGENTNPLARYSLIAQGEQIHIATYPPAWPTKRSKIDENYRLGENIRIRAAAHSFEGKLFTIAVSALLDDEAISYISRGSKDIEDLLRTAQPPQTFVVGPDGRVISDELVGKEGIVYAEIDLSKIIEEKQYHDIASESYNRFDIFHFEMDTRTRDPLRIKDWKEV